MTIEEMKQRIEQLFPGWKIKTLTVMYLESDTPSYSAWLTQGIKICHTCGMREPVREVSFYQADTFDGLIDGLVEQLECH